MKKKAKTPIYRGLFLKNRVDRYLILPAIPEGWKVIKNQHVTLTFAPKETMKERYRGRKIPLKITGYAFNPYKGLALSVDLIREHTPEVVIAEWEQMIARGVNPHITIAVAEGVKPVEATKLFSPEEAEFYAEPVLFSKLYKITASYDEFFRREERR